MSGDRIGEVTNYIEGKSMAVIVLTGPVCVGDIVHIFGHSTDLRQEVRFMQIDQLRVDEAVAGTEITLKVNRRVRRHDKVFKLTDEG